MEEDKKGTPTGWETTEVTDGGVEDLPDDWYDPSYLGDCSKQSSFVTKRFSPEQWLKFFKEYTSKAWMDHPQNRGLVTRMHHGLRVVIALQTIDACRQGFYYVTRTEGGSASDKVIRFDKEFLHSQIRKTKAYRNTPSLPPLTDPVDTEISVYEGDCIEAGRWLQLKGRNPAVLNMANQTQPGGGFHTGSGAQEENLHRRSNYYQSLEDPEKINPGGGYKNYPMSDSGAIYSPNILVFRSSEATGYAYLAEPYLMSFIACAALRHPTLIHDKASGLYNMDEDATERMRAKIHTILAVAALQGHDSLVLSAFGCGAFCCPPRQVAELFKEALVGEEGGFAGRFKEVVFAIFDDHNAKKRHNPEGNVKPFVDVFQKKCNM